MKKTVQIFALFFFSMGATLSYISCDTNTETNNPDSQILTLSIKGMTCIDCAQTISTALKAKEGIYEAKIDHTKDEQNAEITYNPGIITEQEVRKVITSMDFLVG